MQNSHKWHFYLHNPKKSTTFAPVNLRRGMFVHHRRRVADIFKRRLLTLCSDALKCRKFQTDRNIATVDVLRDIECPFCAYWVHYLRILYTYARVP